LQQAIDIFVANVSQQLPAKRLERFVDGGQDRFVRAALLDLFVEALFDEDPLQGPEVELVLELLFFKLQFAF